MADSPAAVRKVVGSESGPALTAVFVATGLHDLWALGVVHLGWWPLSDTLFQLGSMGLFFLFRSTHGGAGPPVEIGERLSAMRQRTADAIAAHVESVPEGISREELVDRVRAIGGRVPRP